MSVIKTTLIKNAKLIAKVFFLIFLQITGVWNLNSHIILLNLSELNSKIQNREILDGKLSKFQLEKLLFLTWTTLIWNLKFHLINFTVQQPQSIWTMTMWAAYIIFFVPRFFVTLNYYFWVWGLQMCYLINLPTLNFNVWLQLKSI